MTKLEEIARAMAKRNWSGATESDIDEMWEGWVEEARAALDTLAIPTPEMIEAGQDSGPVGCCLISDRDARAIWSAMIGAAVGEGR